MAWQEPKTDWNCYYTSSGKYTGDYFNVADYDRIRGNFQVLWNLAAEVLPSIAEGSEGLPDFPTITAESFVTPGSLNVFERSIDVLLPFVQPYYTVQTKTWAAQQAAPGYGDWNRIESAQLNIYNILVQQAAARGVLAVTLADILGGEI